MPFLAGAVLIGLAVEFKTNPAAPVQPSTSRPSKPGYVLLPIPSSAVHHGQAGIPQMGLWESTSANWSGYAVPMIGSGITDTFSDVQGSWQIPAVTGTNGIPAYSSVWIGLDGYEDGTVEQIGTEQDWTGSGHQDYVWFEMYPGGSYLISGFPAKQGDWISAQVQYEGAGVYQLTIVNTTQSASFTVPGSYTTSATATRQSAEWVVEAPYSDGILPLAHYENVNFSDCQATGANGIANPISYNKLGWPADPLTMVDPNGGGSVPTALSDKGTAFLLRWSAQ